MGTAVDRWALEEVRRLVLRRVAGLGVRVLLFGSRARGDGRTASDIEIALDAGDRPVPWGVLALLREDLEESRVPFRVDVADLSSADRELRAAVAREGVPWTD